MARLFLIFALLAATFLSPVLGSAQGSTDEAVAAETAVELSYYESVGDLNALYDRVHPDVHSVVPRAAVIGWYQNDFLPLGPGVATVTAVRFIEWTWPVTGRVYPYTAEVSFTQSFADGSVVDEKVRLVQDATGQWRWFFGRSRQFVEEQIARYAPIPPPVEAAGSVVDVATADVDAFWESAFSGADRIYASPTIIAFDGLVTSSCGSYDVALGPAFYCAAEASIYYAPLWFSEFESQIGDFAWVTVMAHEWGHHVQYLLDVPRGAGNTFELQADCLAGSYARDAATRGLLDEGDVTEAVSVASVSGDPVGLPQDAEGAHGTSDDRIVAFMGGYINGFLGCDLPISGIPSVGGDTSSTGRSVESGESLAALLPDESDVPADLDMVADRQRSLDQVAANYSDPAETARRFSDWGWEGNVTRTFEGNGASGGIASIYVSIHRFGSSSGASRALDHSVTDQIATTDAREVTIAQAGDRTRALSVRSAGADEVTVYAQQDGLLIRVTVISDGDAERDALAVIETCLRNAG